MAKRTWEPTVVEDLAFIPLTQGKWAIIDLADLGLVRPYTWYATDPRHRLTQYAETAQPYGAGKIKMHTLVYGPCADGYEIDHINNNGLDNRQSNFREVTRSQNSMNRPPQNGKTSRYKGVYFRASRGKWVAELRGPGRTKLFHRTFTDEEDAARAYDEQARLHHGEHAWLNFPEDA